MGEIEAERRDSDLRLRQVAVVVVSCGVVQRIIGFHHGAAVVAAVVVVVGVADAARGVDFSNGAVVGGRTGCADVAGDRGIGRIAKARRAGG